VCTSEVKADGVCRRDFDLAVWYEKEHPVEAYQYMMEHAAFVVTTGLWWM
jgi:hypothetical protein